MRRGSVVALLGISVLSGGVATAVAVLLPWLPADASRQAGRIDFVFWFVIAICIAIFAVVAAVMIYAVLRFRAQPDDLEDGPPIHGHTGLEIGWTLVPFVLVTAIAIVSGIVLSRNDAEASNTLHVNVTAQQFEWTFSYPEANNATSPVLRLPEGRSVELDMRSLDVIHAFFVPQFRTNEDIVPGLVSTVHITADRVGTFPLICNELCGLGHALMRTQAIVMTPAAFDSWLRKQKQASSATAGSSSQAAPTGLSVFNANSCSSCHTLTAAGATGKVGPDLDKLVAWAKQAKAAPLSAFIRQSIINPNAYIQPGNVCGGHACPSSTMPQNFGQTLSTPELNALVQFLVQSSEKASQKG
jgi:cytochrome c oxidase subunit II